MDNYKIKVSPYFPDDLVSYYNENMNIHLPDYTNYTIDEINGVPAFDYFMTYANSSVGMAKDAGARLNYAMTLPEPRDDIPVILYGYWQQRTHRNPFPETDAIIYSLTSPSGEKVQLTLPWSFQALKTYTGVDSWKEDYYAPVLEFTHGDISYKQRDIEERPKEMIMDISSNRIKHHKNNLVNNVYGFEASSSMGFELLVNSSHLTFWQLSDNQTLVMYLDTMAPGRLSGYYPSLVKGFQIAAERGLTRLIIDLSNNGGGNICLGRSLLAFFQKDGWDGEGQNWGPEDLPLSTFYVQSMM